MIRQLGKVGYRLLTKRSKLKKLSQLANDGLPQGILSSLTFFITREVDSNTKAVITKAENRRNMLSQQGQRKVPIWYSPKPNSADLKIQKGLPPEPGETLYFTMEKIARTGKDQTWGTVLHLLTHAFQPKVAIELGSCAGISAMYIASVDSLKTFITLEGSPSLADIAKESLQAYSNTQVINNLFDVALDEVLPAIGQSIDLAYIDGHHEKVATLHYFDRLLPYLSPGSVVIFDDISWSYDMREAWHLLTQRNVFSHTIDMGAIGVCILNQRDETVDVPINWDLQVIIGKHSIGSPHGWQ